ncbi:hypothetical protein BDV96DRAFT_506267 [Lophiotrema nucula]|uniref:DUF7962 domain-containing protein n=1 Tax=Lophiotrema nucula TaxID=690887 RepID=A0A6A5YK50_9PLEO|nr:hypothetical protein BDV96DRAFT_506267 [Lophiotrema nucula]
MMPRPLLHTTFGLTYRKIPILAIGREIYCDTSLIIEALEHYFPPSQNYGTIYPKLSSGELDEWAYKGLVRGFASFWTDRPFFRVTTGLIPSSVWETEFGTDRAGLIGHKLDPAKLGAKIPQNLSNLDLHLSLLEPTFSAGTWCIPTQSPSLADVSLYYQLRWGIDIAAGKGIYNLTAGGTQDTTLDVTDSVFNEERYPGVWTWFHTLESYLASLPDLETPLTDATTSTLVDLLGPCAPLRDEDLLVPTPAGEHSTLDVQRGLVEGVQVSIAPDDTGRDSPTVGKLVRIGVEEVVVEPSERGRVDVRIHFPRLGFGVRVLEGSRL